MPDDALDYFRNMRDDGATGINLADLFDRNGMTPERYNDLMDNPELKLTEGELRVGWYWSPAWDGMLVHKTWEEAKFDYPDKSA